MKDCGTCKWEPNWVDHPSSYANWQSGYCKFPLPVCVEKTQVSKCVDSQYGIYQFRGGAIHDCPGWQERNIIKKVGKES